METERAGKSQKKAKGDRWGLSVWLAQLAEGAVLWVFQWVSKAKEVCGQLFEQGELSCHRMPALPCMGEVCGKQA